MSMFDGENNTAKNFKKFYDAIYPYLNASPTMGYTPVGSVIAMMSTNAPQFYLKCDGAVYNIVDYPELANHFEKEFGSKNFFGGDGATTFAVPDLRGEFLRGTGTNSHTGTDSYGNTYSNGNGGDVGEHQDATLERGLYIYPSELRSYYYSNEKITGYNPYGPSAENADSYSISVSNAPYTKTSATQATNGTTSPKHTIRPTNTSVLYCIATKDIYVDARFDYSTSEKVVGKWIDGKPLYQKTFAIQNPSNKFDMAHNIANIDTIANYKGFIRKPNGEVVNMNWADSYGINYCMQLWVDKTNFYFDASKYTGFPFTDSCEITVQYTKTTD